ncbi:MAG: hypothetical protein WAL52_22030 [Candidatus Sulfotelmatobacter sp.]
MPDLNHSSKAGEILGATSIELGVGKGMVTFGARKTHEALPFLMGCVEQ